jgi:hypothetical protein
MLDLLKYVTAILEKNQIKFTGIGFNGDETFMAAFGEDSTEEEQRQAYEALKENHSFKVDFTEDTTEEEKQRAYTLLQKDYTSEVSAYKALVDYDTTMGREAEDLVALKLSLDMSVPQILLNRYNTKQQLRQDYLNLL